MTVVNLPLAVKMKRWCVTGSVTFLILNLVVICAVLLYLYLTFNPPQRVQVRLINLPPEVYFACLVSRTDQGMEVMDWSPESEIMMPFAMHPARCVWSFRDTDSAGDDTTAYVNWRNSSYGIVTRSKKCAWKIAWFKSGDIE